MIIIGAGILIVLTLILGVLIAFLYGIAHQLKTPPIPDSTALTEMVSIMKEERDAFEREKQEEEMREYALNKIKQKPLPIQASTSQADRPVNVHGRSNELVPFNLSETDKKILEMFYDK